VREQVRDNLGFIDMGEQQLKNISRALRTYALRPGATPAQRESLTVTPTGAGSASKPLRLSIVVLPFTNLGGDPAQEYFSDGITDEVTAQLSKIKGSYIVGRATALKYKGKELDIKTLGIELGVRYVLKGSVERFEEGVDTTAQLVDGLNGVTLWADTIEVDKNGVRNIRRELVNRLAIALNFQLIEAEAKRSHADGFDSQDATDVVMQARSAYYRANTLESIQRVKTIFEKALAIKPDDQSALCGRAFMLVEQAFGWPGRSGDESLDEAERVMTIALPLDRRDAYAHYVMFSEELNIPN
jgi:TolB-like protein